MFEVLHLTMDKTRHSQIHVCRGGQTNFSILMLVAAAPALLQIASRCSDPHCTRVFANAIGADCYVALQSCEVFPQHATHPKLHGRQYYIVLHHNAEPP